MPSFFKPDSAAVTLGLAAVIAIGVSALVTYLPDSIGGTVQQQQVQRVAQAGSGTTTPAATQKVWEASAPGRVAPKGGEVEIRTEVPGVIQRVYSKVNDKVRQGDLLAVIKDDEAYARIEAARAEVDVRVAEREEDEEPKNALLEALRAAQDELGAAERRLHSARLDFDREFIARRDGKSTDADVDKARQRIDDAKGEILERRKAVEVAQAKEGLPLLTRLDSGLTIARSDLTLAELAFDKTRVRATADGTVLQLEATAGETATPAAPVPLAVIGNISSLEVTAEVEERDISKVWLEQDVVIRANAFAGQEFAGKVTHIAPRVGRPGLGLRSASEPRDVEVLEVDIELQGKTPLLPGMRVDVFFKPKAAMKAAAKN